MQHKSRSNRATITSNRREPSEQIAQWISSRIGPHKYGMWFTHARFLVDGRHVRVLTDSPFAAKWIGSHFGRELQQASEAVVGEGAKIEVHVVSTAMPEPDQEAAKDTAGDAPDVAEKAARLRNGTLSRESHAHPGRHGSHRMHAPRRLCDFVVGESNRLAHNASCRLAEDADPRLLSPLFLHGPCGVGKTHLLLGICERFKERWPSARVRYVPAEQFTNEYIAAVRNDKIEEFRRRLRKLDFFAIDDIHFLSNKMRTQTEFLHTLDAIAMSGARVALASDGHPRQISKFNQALVSRFLSGMVVQIELPDRELRKALVRKIAAARRLPLSEAAAEALATRCVGSARELEGAITKLTALYTMNSDTSRGSDHKREPVGLVLVEQLFGMVGGGGNGFVAGSGRRIRIGDIIDVICERLAVERADLTGTSRHQRIVLARGLVAHLSREMTTMSYPEIAQALGRKYHSTIHTAAKRLGRQLSAGERIAVPAGGEIALVDFVDQLRHEIGRGSAH